MNNFIFRLCYFWWCKMIRAWNRLSTGRIKITQRQVKVFVDKLLILRKMKIQCQSTLSAALEHKLFIFWSTDHIKNINKNNFLTEENRGLYAMLTLVTSKPGILSYSSIFTTICCSSDQFFSTKTKWTKLDTLGWSFLKNHG